VNEGPNWPYWRGCSRISIHCEKILILEGIENGGFLTFVSRKLPGRFGVKYELAVFSVT